jgi:hypothetical protein
LAKAKINKSVLQSLIKLNFGLIDWQYFPICPNFLKWIGLVGQAVWPPQHRVGAFQE